MPGFVFIKESWMLRAVVEKHMYLIQQDGDHLCLRRFSKCLVYFIV